MDARAPDALVSDAGNVDAGDVDAGTVDAATVDAASVEAWRALPACADGVLASLTIARIAPLARDTDTYRPPPAATADGVASVVAALAVGDVPAAESSAAAASYLVCRGTGAEDGLVLVRPIADATGHAFLALRLADARPLVLEAPHPIYDADTEIEAVAIFARTHARAVMVAGTHRCASDRPSGCTGTADACGIDAVVRESDMAHAVDSVFQAAHVALANAYSDDWFVGVHGFGGPGISVSNGTEDPTPATSRSARLATLLHARFGDDVTTCNDFGDASISRSVRVCGTWDVQGRSLRGSPMSCTTDGTGDPDRFVHVEQAPEYRPEQADAIADALLAVLAP